jgi:cbb3-type cytochrome oxidase subunit 1
VPALSVWSIRAALLYLGTGFTLGGVMLAAPGLQLPQAVIRLRPLHTELLLVGWMVQLAFGVAYWILPRTGQGRRTGLALAALLLLNLGVLTVGLGTLLALPERFIVAGRVAELVAALAFGAHAWPRARAYSPFRNPSSQTF